MGAVLPLLALRAFAEVGRRGSVKDAAQALGVTSGAVSQQIRLLEERIGVALFEREHRGLHLSEAGAQVHAALARAFDQIESTLATLDGIRMRQTLTVSSVPSFAASWLVPRLGRFTQRHPEIEIRVEASSTVVDLKRERVDVALRHGLGAYPGLRSTLLVSPRLVPVASRDLLAKGPPLKSPQDCRRYPLLHNPDRADWRMWLRAQGAEDDAGDERGPSFDDDILLIRAAEAGQGMALVRDVYVRDEISSGRLCIALQCPQATKFAYYAVTTAEAAKRPAVQVFVEWLSEEASRSSEPSLSVDISAAKGKPVRRRKQVLRP